VESAQMTNVAGSVTIVDSWLWSVNRPMWVK
jgi:hypothetical protein